MVLALLAAGYHWREPLASWLLPIPPQTTLLTQAEQALADGRLTSPDGRGARELFAAVLALAPDDSRARAGLTRVGEAALAEAEQALAADRRDLARDRLTLAREVGVAVTRTEPLAEALRRRDSVEDELQRLLAGAKEAQRAGRLDEGEIDDALSFYRRMLELDPDNPIARAGRAAVQGALLQRADAALGEDDPIAAGVAIARVEAIDPSHLGLPGARARLAEALEARIERAESARAEGDLERADAELEPILRAWPEHAGARALAARSAEDWLARAERHIAEMAFDSAELALLRAGRLTPAAPGLARLEGELRRQREVERADPADRTAQAERLLAEAELALASGRALSPPDDNAWDRLERAAALVPGDLRIGRARLAVARHARDCLEQVRRPADLPGAGDCLRVLAAFDPADPALPAQRRQLADRWLGLAGERLGVGELDAARRALRAATEIDPEHPGLPELERRLRRVGESGVY